MTPFLLIMLLTTSPPPAVPPGDAGTPATGLFLTVTDVKANHLSVYGKKHEFLWVGDVKAKHQDVTLTCDRLTGFWTGSSEQVTRMRCDGHVVVVENDRRGWGEHADFDNVNSILVFTGNPHASQGINQFEGDKVTFYVGTDQLEVENASGQMDSAATKGKLGQKKAPKAAPPAPRKP